MCVQLSGSLYTQYFDTKHSKLGGNHRHEHQQQITSFRDEETDQYLREGEMQVRQLLFGKRLPSFVCFQDSDGGEETKNYIDILPFLYHLVLQFFLNNFFVTVARI